jgi:hypothetical protein
MSESVPNDPLTNDTTNDFINDPLTNDTNDFLTDPLTNDTTDVISNDPLTNDTTILEPPPLPIIFQSQAALIICNGRLSEIDKIKVFLFEQGFTEESIVVLKEDDQDKMPTYENITRYIQTLVGHSTRFNKIWIYYCGQGINDVDCLDKTIVFLDTSLTIHLIDYLRQTCCETVCLVDMSCLTPEIGFKWGVDVNNKLKIVTFCESSPMDSVQRVRTIPF